MTEQAEHLDGSSLSLLAKAALILGAFEGKRPALTLTDVVQHCGLSQSTVHRLLDQLVTIGWLERERRQYRLGLRLVELGGFALHHNRLRRAALPHLVALHQATGHWIHLAVLDGSDIVYLEQIGDPRHSTMPFQVGARLPAYCTAAGKALLAFGAATTSVGVGGAESVVAAESLVPRTRRTITRADLLQRELATIRIDGAAFDREECFQGLSCVAAPLRGAGRAPAAISLSRTVGNADLVRLAPQVSSCAKAIWKSMVGVGRTSRQQEHLRSQFEPAAPASADDTLFWVQFDEWN